MTDQPITYDRCRDLANSALRSIAATLIAQAEHDHWGDDCGDYLNAANDQLSWLTAVLVDTDPRDAIANFTWLLNAPRDSIDDPASDPACPQESRGAFPMGWIYGYADHNTEISDLMRANKEDS